MSLFTRIAQGEIPSYCCGSDERHYAFLDIAPLARGHVLVIPRREEDYIFDLSDEETAALHIFARRVARAIRAAYPCRKVAEVVLGLEVPHAHIHLIPMQSEADVDFRKPKLQLPADEMQQIADRIRAEFDKLA